jgi:hypothetical protein
MEFFNQSLSRDFTPYGFCYLLARGTTHLMEIWNVWRDSYLLTSVVTVPMLIPLPPKAISLPGRSL